MKGAYCLVIEVSKDTCIAVGSLNKLLFKRGQYIYIGSAMNNLKKRIERHLSDEKKIFWHIDYLLESDRAKIIHVYWKESSEKEECTIARKMAQWGEPIKKFGCSDCTCESHLFRIDESITLQDIPKDMGIISGRDKNIV